MSKKQSKGKLRINLNLRILIISLLPLFVIGIVACAIVFSQSNSLINSAMEDTLKATAISIRESYSLVDEGDYYEDDGIVFKGDTNLSEYTNIVDVILNDADMVSTIFWDNTRIMTSLRDEQGNRKIGTTLDNDEILEKVLNKGDGVFVPNFAIGDANYYVYYLPLYQDGSDSQIVGMVFVGEFADDVARMINKMLIIIILAVVLVIVISTIIVILSASAIAKALKHSVSILDSAANGDLTTTIEQKHLRRGDEISDLLFSIGTLKDNLTNIVSNIKQNSAMLLDSSGHLEQTAKETENTVEQVEKAVNDIAEGATSQAQETQKASEDVIVMGDMITQTSHEVKKLDENSNSMRNSSDEATQTLGELKTINQKSIDAIEIIYEQTNTTNESALKIQEATHLITSIAEETNLLSLNASIEAARAGEQGRGFAVVAAQIQKLAEQSNDSALKIEEIITSLISDSDKAVQTMQEVKQIMDNQSKNVEKTEKIFDTVKRGIDQSFVNVENIADQTTKLDEARISIVDIVQNLTAVAEENAASTEETSAASAEVFTTVSNVADAAVNLKNIADSIEENINVFKI